MKKVLSLLMACLLCFSLAACGSADSGKKDSGKPDSGQTDSGKKEETTKTQEGKKIRVCIVYTGNLGDKSYNDSCNAGAERAKADFGIELKSLEGTTAQEWEANLVAACEEGYDLVIGASSNIADYITEHAENYPNVKFAVIDTTVDLLICRRLSPSVLLKTKVRS